MYEFIKELLIMFCCGYLLTAFLIISVGAIICLFKQDELEEEKDS